MIARTEPHTPSARGPQARLAWPLLALAGTLLAWVGTAGAQGRAVASPVAAATKPAPPALAAPTATLTVRAKGSLAAGVGPVMEVRVDGIVRGSVEVRNTALADFRFAVPGLAAGARIDVVFTNDAVINGEDRNLTVSWLGDGRQLVLPGTTAVTYDRGSGAGAFDGKDVIAGQGEMPWAGALRLAWPAPPAVADPNLRARRAEAVRLLQQATFGATEADVATLVSQPHMRWVDNQIAIPYQTEFADHVQAKFNQGDAWRPGGTRYTTAWLPERFWRGAATAPDQLRRRVAYALHQILVVSLADGNLYQHGRAYGQYLDILHRHAFGNYRNLLEDIALSPAMGIYLSHMRNQREDPATGRSPDENFARELMQLFTIGLHELHPDGSLVTGPDGNPVETYTNDDVMALAKVFTGFSWAFPDAELTESKFLWGWPDYRAANDTRIDLLPMKPYLGQHSQVEKRLFAGKRWEILIPAVGAPLQDVRMALDGLFRHPNLGPFIGRQLIQHLVASHPSPAYVQRVARTFDNNGQGVRGDLAAVVRAVLLDPEARTPAPVGSAMKLREPVLRATQWMRTLGARSITGEYMMAYALDTTDQRALSPPSVFNYFRPGYVPRSAAFSAQGVTAPELQILTETSAASWINIAEAMAGNGLGWTGSAADVSVDHAALAARTGNGNPMLLADHLDTWLLGGRMSSTLRQAIVQACEATTSTDGASRARAAVFLTLASPEYQVQN